jgi:hypothetical protein
MTKNQGYTPTDTLAGVSYLSVNLPQYYGGSWSWQILNRIGSTNLGRYLLISHRYWGDSIRHPGVRSQARNAPPKRGNPQSTPFVNQQKRLFLPQADRRPTAVWQCQRRVPYIRYVFQVTVLSHSTTKSLSARSKREEAVVGGCSGGPIGSDRLSVGTLSQAAVL